MGERPQRATAATVPRREQDPAGPLATWAITLARRLLPNLLVALLGAAAALTLLGMTTGSSGDVGPGRVELRARAWQEGRTTVELPPLGAVSAHTHGLPIALEARVDRLHIEEVQRLLTRPDPQAALVDAVRDDLGPLVRELALRAALTGVVVGAVVGAVVPGRRWRHVLAGLAGGLVVVVGLLGVSWTQFDPGEFAVAARFEGPLERAPSVLETVQRHVAGFEDVEGRMEVLSQQVADLYAAATTERLVTAAGETVILHISDIHSNPLGLEITRQLVEQFRVDAVVDTGDLTSFGLPVEARIADLVQRIDVPYYFVPGNHDSPEVRARLSEEPGLTVLDGEVAEIGGVAVLGVADPTFTAENTLPREEATRRIRSAGARTGALVRSLRPDVLAVHNPLQAVDSLGLVPVVIAGHVHESRFDVREGSLVLTVGSTGATGIGSFTVETDLPYEAALLRFVGGRLTAVDSVSFRGVSGNFRIDRRMVEEELLELTPPQVPTRFGTPVPFGGPAPPAG